MTGGEFEEVRNAAEKGMFTMRSIPPRYPQANGTVERLNRDIGRLLKVLQRKNVGVSWVELLPLLASVLNATPRTGGVVRK